MEEIWLYMYWLSTDTVTGIQYSHSGCLETHRIEIAAGDGSS